MSTDIFYFSGTGNSYSVARELSIKLSGRLLPIDARQGGELVDYSSSSIIGIVFPRYYGYEIGIPMIVKSFISKLEHIEDSYIFAVCTYGGGFGNALSLVNELLQERGGKLSAGFGIHMPQNCFNKPWVNNKKLISESIKKCDAIAARVVGGDYHKIEKPNVIFKAITKAFVGYFRKAIRKGIAGCAEIAIDEPFDKLVKLADKSFKVDATCTGCGLCQKLCPVSNIAMANNRPQWLNRCENCLACYDWCPTGSIHCGIVMKDFRYRHPQAKAGDFLPRIR